MSLDWRELFESNLGVQGLLVLLVRCFIHTLIALFNPFDSYGPNYASFNPIFGTVSTGSIDVADFLVDIVYVNHLSFSIQVNFSLINKSIDIKLVIEDMDIIAKVESNWTAFSAVPTAPRPLHTSSTTEQSFDFGEIMSRLAQCVKHLRFELKQGSIGVNDDLLFTLLGISVAADFANFEFSGAIARLQLATLSPTTSVEDLVSCTALTFRQIRSPNLHNDMTVAELFVSADNAAAHVLVRYLTVLASLQQIETLSEMRTRAVRQKRELLLAIQTMSNRQGAGERDRDDCSCYFNCNEHQSLGSSHFAPKWVAEDVEDVERQCTKFTATFTTLIIKLSTVDHVQELFVLNNISATHETNKENQVHFDEAGLSVQRVRVCYLAVSQRSYEHLAVSDASSPWLSIEVQQERATDGATVFHCNGSAGSVVLAFSVQALQNLGQVFSMVTYFSANFSARSRFESIDQLIEQHKQAVGASHPLPMLTRFGRVAMVVGESAMRLHLNQHHTLHVDLPLASDAILSCTIRGIVVEAFGSSGLGMRCEGVTVQSAKNIDYSNYDLSDGIVLGELATFDDIRVVVDGLGHSQTAVDVVVSSSRVTVNQHDLALVGQVQSLLVPTTGTVLPLLSRRFRSWKCFALDDSSALSVTVGVGLIAVRLVYVNEYEFDDNQAKQDHGVQNDLVIYTLLDASDMSVQSLATGNFMTKCNLALSGPYQLYMSRYARKGNMRAGRRGFFETDDEVNQMNNNDNNKKVLVRCVAQKDDAQLYNITQPICTAPAAPHHCLSSTISGVSGANALSLAFYSSLAELHATTDLVLGYYSSTTVVNLANPTVLFDYNDVHELLILMNVYGRSCDSSRSIVDTREAVDVFESIEPIERVLEVPTAVLVVNMNKLHITGQHLYRPTLHMGCNRLALSSVSYGDHIYQTNASLTNFSLYDLSADYIIHKGLVTSVDANGGVVNSVSFHHSSLKPLKKSSFGSEAVVDVTGLLEISIKHIRVLYLHRATFTVLCYVMDYLMPLTIETLKNPKYLSGPSCPVPVACGSTMSDDSLPLVKGLFRFCVSINHSELCLPTNSCSMEALVIMFKELTLHPSNDYYNHPGALKRYCQGPLIERNAFVSELDNVELHVLALGCQDAQHLQPERSRAQWQRQALQAELLHDLLPIATTCQTYLFIELSDATMCSWCNNNIMFEHQDLSVRFSLYRITPYDADNYTNQAVFARIAGEEKLHDIRNTMVIHVTANEVDWILNQGQYWAIVNLIQQNFSELQEHVVDPYTPPDFQSVRLSEECYALFGLDRALPIINSVPIQITKGKVTFMFNESAFYSRFMKSAPRAPLFSLYQAHNIHYEMPDTLPDVEHVSFIRHQCYNQWGVCPSALYADRNAAQQLDLGADYNSKYNAIYNLHREQAESSPFCLLLEEFYIDFYRKHFGGGSGIEAYAKSFIVVGVDDDAYEHIDPLQLNDNLFNMRKLFEEVDIKTVLFAPKSCPYFHHVEYGANSERTYRNASEDPAAVAGLEREAEERSEMRDDTSACDDGADGQLGAAARPELNEYLLQHLYPPSYPDINEFNAAYNAELHLPFNPVYGSRFSMHDAAYNNADRYPSYPHMRYSQQTVNNLRRCVVHAEESVVVAHFQIIMSVVKYFNHPVRITNDRNSTVVVENHGREFDYKEALDVEVHLENTLIFIPNFNVSNPGPANGGSATTTTTISAVGAIQTVSGTADGGSASGRAQDCTGLGINTNLHYTHAWRGFQFSGPGSAQSCIVATLLNMFIAPLYECNITDIISLLDVLTIDLSVSDRVQPKEGALFTNSNLLLHHVSLGDWVSRTNKFDRPSNSRIMKFSMKNLHNRNIYDTEERNILNTTETNISNLRSRFSLKDIEFFLSALNKLRGSVQKQLLKAPKRDPYHYIAKYNADIRHLPDNTAYLVHAELDEGVHTDIKEFDSEIHNFDVVVHNNTYNLNILNVVVSEICLVYTRSLDHIHMAAGVLLSVNSFNDSLDSWEPVVEPVHIRAIGATDATFGQPVQPGGPPGTTGGLKATTGLLNASKIRIEVSADRVELNASQSTIANLLYKLHLNDVVTTSSNRLPPYKIINQLGINIYFNIGFNGGIVINNVIHANSSLPIEINQLTAALNTYKMRKLYNTHATNALGGMTSQMSREYLLWISFINLRDVYESHTPLSIDKVGTTPFEMVKTNRKHDFVNPVVNQGQQHLLNTPGGVETVDNADVNSPIKFVSEVPLTLMQMQVQPNGIRELYIRSMLSIHNNTQRVMFVSIKLYGSSIETCLFPSKVYYVPVRFANPKASLLLRFAKSGGNGVGGHEPTECFFEAMHSMSAFIAQGSWGNPQRLRAHLCLCPPEDAVPAFPTAVNAAALSYMVMLKPEVRQINTLTAASANKFSVPLKYPAKEQYVNRVGSKDWSPSNNVNVTTTAQMNAPIKAISTNLSSMKPLCIHIQAPLIFCNVLPQPMLYKLASDSNGICAEGLLLPGQVVDVYNVSSMFNSKLFVSVRLSNYAWSKWYMLCSRSAPYSTTEKTTDVTLQPLQFKPMPMSQLYKNAERSADSSILINLPTLDVTIVQKEYLVRFTCQIVLSNFSKIPLFAAEADRPETFVLLSAAESSAPAVPTMTAAAAMAVASMRLHRPVSTSYQGSDSIPAQLSTLSHLSIVEEEGDESQRLSGDETNEGEQNASVHRNICNLAIYLPHDHLKKIAAHVPLDCTLDEVFSRIKPQLSNVYQLVNSSDYLFFPYCAAKPALNLEGDMVGETTEPDELAAGVSSAEASSTPSQAQSASPSSTPNRGLFRRNSKSMDSRALDGVVPVHLRYNMSVDFTDPIPMQSSLLVLAGLEVMLVHKSEYAIYLQAKQIVVETSVESSTTLFNSVFGKSKTYSYLANYSIVEGSIPYKPHRMLSFNAHLCVKDIYNTDWSNAVDVVKTDFDVGELVVNVKSKFHRYDAESSSLSRSQVVHYELGAYFERGRGLLQHSTVVTFVPKRILVSKLAFALQFRQITADATNEGVEAELGAGATLHYYFVDKQKVPILQVRRAVSGRGGCDDTSAFAVSSAPGDWYGELDICHLGVVYTKLRNPMVIVKVETEVIGASYISTLSEQSLTWPPYRLLNSTNMNMRFKQAVDDPTLAATIPYDALKPKQSMPFAWDFPHSAAPKRIRLEVENNNNTFVSKEVNLYDLYNNNQSDSIVIKTFIPNIGNPLAEGFLMMNAEADAYRRVYCILRPDTLYIYEDESRNVLLNIINLSYQAENNSIKYATVSKISDNKNSLFAFFSSKAAAKTSQYDINTVRIMMLTLANFLHLLSHLTPDAFHERKSRADSMGSVDLQRESSFDSPPALGGLTAKSCLADKTTSITTLFTSIPDESAVEMPLTASLAPEGFVDELVAAVPDLAPEADLAGAEALASSAIATPPLQPINLHALLDGGVSVEQLLEELANTPVHLGDVISALTDCSIVDTEEQAMILCEYLIVEGFITKKNAFTHNRGSIYGYDARSDSAEADDDDSADDEGFGRDTLIGGDVNHNPFAVGIDEASARREMTKALTDSIRKRYAAMLKGEKLAGALSIVDEYMNEDLLFNPPTLCPELAVAMEKDGVPVDRRSVFTPSTSAPTGPDEQFGFSITVGNTKYHFKCASEMEYLGWLQSSRTSIELAWRDIELGKKKVSTQTVEDFQISLTVRVKADGSTKVLEVLEKETNAASSAAKKLAEIRGTNKKTTLASGMKRRSAAVLMPLLNRSRRLLSQVGSTEAEPEEFNLDAVDKDQELIAVSFDVKAVSLSLIDATPVEILYIGLNDINMGVVRYFDAVQFSVTVRNIQISNQLLNPTFPVVLFARRMKQSPSGRLMLPGLDADLYSQSYPTLHLYLQQRYHDIGTNPSAPPSADGTQRLWYFDIFTVWLAPLQLALDEEIVVRLMRFAWNIRSSLATDADQKISKPIKDEVAVNLHSTRFMQNQMDHREVYNCFQAYMQCAKRVYDSHSTGTKAALNIYFSLLQLHPLDITMNFRPSPEVQLTNAELAVVAVIAQLDAARLCLNALYAENAFGSTTIISEIIVKHYRGAFWRQFHRLLGATDLVEGSVGLVANLGTGFYDLFYEPIDGLLDENRSFLHGLSKGGISLASRAIGGTSAFASTISGGLGKGVSLLTLDIEFQKARSLRRYNKTNSVSEGLRIGTQELGKNIVEGVTGIVVAPLKGWETGGSVGFGVGIAKGILGVAVKPVVGVFDLASRATEGIRNTAFTSDTDINVEMQGTYRSRIPRSFGRAGLLLVYDPHAAAAQYMVDSLTGFRADPRFVTISHLYLVRKLSEDQRYHNFMFKIQTVRRRDSNVNMVGGKEEETENLQEAWGLHINRQYLVVVGSERVALLEILDPDEPNSGSHSGLKQVQKKSAAEHHRRFVWSCPATCIDQLCCDNRGDLVLTLSSSVCITGHWNNTQPTLLELGAQNHLIMQSLLEQTVGVKQARMQPLNPWTGLTQRGIRKRYNSGIRSFILAPTLHTYRLFGSVLYEYTPVSKKPTKAAERTVSDDAGSDTAASIAHRSESVLNSAEYAEKLIKKLFDPAQALRRDTESRERRRGLLQQLQNERLRNAQEEDVEEDGKEEEEGGSEKRAAEKAMQGTALSDSKGGERGASPLEIAEGRAIETQEEQVRGEEVNAELSVDSVAEISSGTVEDSMELDRGEESSETPRSCFDSTPYGLDTIRESAEEEEEEGGEDVFMRLSEPAVDLDDEEQVLGHKEESGQVGAGDESQEVVLTLQKSKSGETLTDDEGSERAIIRRSSGLQDSDDEHPAATDAGSDAFGEETTPVQPLSTGGAPAAGPVAHLANDEIADDAFLSFVYPLVDLCMTGPAVEDNGRCFSITISRVDGQKMRVLRREDEHEHFAEYKKNSLSLLFATMEQAMLWRHAIEHRIILRSPDPLPAGPLTTEDKRKAARSVIALASRGATQQDPSVPVEGSILSSLVLPTSDTDPELAEMIKIDIARTISGAKR